MPAVPARLTGLWVALNGTDEQIASAAAASASPVRIERLINRPGSAAPAKTRLAAALVTFPVPVVIATVYAPAWTAGELYREAGRPDVRPIELKLVPYFAWGNRGDAEMSVWLPLETK